MLWVRTQARDQLVKVNNLQLEGNAIRSIGSTDTQIPTILGTYDSVDTALMVLDSIQLFIEDIEWYKVAGDYHSVTFEMPE